MNLRSRLEAWYAPRRTSERSVPERVVPRRRARWLKAILAVGFLALSVGLWVAHATPATEYELSIYRSTPLAFWVGAGVALTAGLVVTFALGPGRVRLAALTLAGGTVLAIAALPLVRDYYFFGGDDALTHLGWTREMVQGVFSPWNFLYPGIHTTTLFIGETIGTSLRDSFQYTILAFTLAYFLFVPLCVRTVTGSRWALPVGLFSALLLLPINDISVFLLPHPTTQALMVTPLLFYLAFEFVRDSTERSLPVARLGVLLVVGSAGYVLVHPQQALNVLVVFGTISVLQFVAGRRWPDSPIAAHRRLYVQTGFLAACFFLWAPRNDVAQGAGSRILEDLLAIGIPADEVAQRSGSLTAVGGSIEDLFVKLFLVSLVYALLTGQFAVSSLVGRYDHLPERNAFGRYLSVALAPLFGGFVLLFIASHTTQHFRQVAFLMVIATILGSAAIARSIVVLAERGVLPGDRTLPGLDALSVRLDWERVVPPATRAAVGVFLAACLVLSVMTMFFTPYIYQSSNHVTEAEMSGYETAFTLREPGMPFTGIRSGPERQVDAFYGSRTAETRPFPGDDAVVPGAVLGTNLSTYYAGERYLVVTDPDVQREVGVYRGFRYPASGFRSLETNPDVHRVVSNGEFGLYLLEGRNTSNVTRQARPADVTAVTGGTRRFDAVRAAH